MTCFQSQASGLSVKSEARSTYANRCGDAESCHIMPLSFPEYFPAVLSGFSANCACWAGGMRHCCVIVVRLFLLDGQLLLNVQPCTTVYNRICTFPLLCRLSIPIIFLSGLTWGRVVDAFWQCAAWSHCEDLSCHELLNTQLVSLTRQYFYLRKAYMGDVVMSNVQHQMSAWSGTIA